MTTKLIQVVGATVRRVCCFFFQAEDGIRDSSVTGVQTCALPISAIYGGVDPTPLPRATQFVYRDATGQFHEESAPFISQGGSTSLSFTQVGKEIVEIGRASCRERV